MNINYKQPQFELFPANSVGLEDINKPRFFLGSLTLSLESLVILTILGIMISLFAFSLGVERGKHLTAQALDERVWAAWNLAPRKPVAVQTGSRSANAGKATLAVAVGHMAVSPKSGTPVPRSVGLVPVSKPLPIARMKEGNRGTIVPRMAAPVAPRATGQYTIQTASYENETYARAEAVKLKAKGFKSLLIKKGHFWLVCVGQFASSQSATAALKKIQPSFRGSSVRRY